MPGLYSQESVIAHIPTQPAGMYAPPAGRWCGTSRTTICTTRGGQRIGKLVGGTWNWGIVPWGDVALVKWASSVTYFVHRNNLESSTMATDHAGAVQQDLLYYPWGQAWTTPTVDGTFASMRTLVATQGEETLITPNRFSSATYGRWMSPDPLAGDITNPQSLNRYAYALNNPCTLTDPLGLDPCSCVINLSDPGRLLSASVLATAESVIARILTNAGVGVVFSRTNADFTATVLPANPAPPATGVEFGHTSLTYWGWGPPGNVGDVYLSETYNELRTVGGGDVGLAVGNLATHEFSHFLFGSFVFGTPGSITQEGGWNANMMLSPGLNFASPAAVQSKCSKLHPPTNNPNGRGGGGRAHSGPPYLYMPAGFSGWDVFSFLDWGGGYGGDYNDDVGPGSGWDPNGPPPVLTPRP